jgi:FkbM family methyltransferase
MDVDVDENEVRTIMGLGSCYEGGIDAIGGYLTPFGDYVSKRWPELTLLWYDCLPEVERRQGILMAIAAWKRIEKTPGYQRKKRFLKCLVGKELRLKTEIDVKSVKDGGWCFIPDDLSQDSIVYSLGVGDNIEFDLALIRKYGVEVHAFDPSPPSIDMLGDRDLPSQFHFHTWAVAAEDGSLTLYPCARKDGSKSDIMYTLIAGDASVDDPIEVPAFSLSSITTKLDHDRIDLLKMDIEGAEYEVLDGLLASDLKPTQLLVEFHHRFPGIGLEKTADLIKRLGHAGYKIFAISDIGREVSFLRV